MKELNYDEFQNTQVVDIRPQFAFQEGHIKNSLNLIPRNFETYGEVYLDKEKELAFILDQSNKEDLDKAAEIADENGFNLSGYILIENIPKEDLITLETMPAAEFLEKGNEDYILLDVRHPDEITRPAPEKNLVNIPFEELNQKLNEIDSDKTVYTLCGSGNRSTAAASYLESQGYHTAVIEGGMKRVQEEEKKR